jgi:hypothetical protein
MEIDQHRGFTRSLPMCWHSTGAHRTPCTGLLLPSHCAKERLSQQPAVQYTFCAVDSHPVTINLLGDPVCSVVALTCTVKLNIYASLPPQFWRNKSYQCLPKILSLTFFICSPWLEIVLEKQELTCHSIFIQECWVKGTRYYREISSFRV